MVKTKKNPEGGDPKYLSRINAQKANEVYVHLLDALTKKRRYRDPSLTVHELSRELGYNMRYISASVAIVTGDNFNALVNSLRLRDVKQMMTSARCKDMTLEEIGLLSGFSSRQAFYLAFHRVYGFTPLQYRKKLLADLQPDTK